MAICSDPVKVKKGDKVGIVVLYDLNLHSARTSTHRTGVEEEIGITRFSFTADPIATSGKFS